MKHLSGHNITMNKVGDGLGGYIQPICSCGWVGREHYAYCNHQFSNYHDNIDEHFTQVKREEYGKDNRQA